MLGLELVDLVYTQPSETPAWGSQGSAYVTRSPTLDNAAHSLGRHSFLPLEERIGENKEDITFQLGYQLSHSRVVYQAEF